MTKAEEIAREFAKKANGEEFDEWFFFDKYVEDFDEDMIRKYKDQINYDDFYNRRTGKKIKPHFNPDFVRELLNDVQLDSELKGMIVSYESGLDAYFHWGMGTPDKKLVNEYKNEIREYWENVYGPNIKGLNRKMLNIDEEIRMKQQRNRLLEYI